MPIPQSIELNFLRDTLQLACVLVERIENREEPYEDVTIRAIIEGDEKFRHYHPVSLFSAIQLIDELAQFIKPKRIAEMDMPEAWIWEMKRIFDHLIAQSFSHTLSTNPLVAGMYARSKTIIEIERRKYES
jgi:hypothetical protein